MSAPQTTVDPEGPALVGALESFGRNDILVAGGKGANLGEMLRADLPIPSGFVITTHAYEAVARLIEPSGAAMAEALASVTVPDDVRAVVLAAYHRLGGGPVAVRSSATAEDLPGATFAGQQETYLNVIDDAGLLDAVRGCWASLWAERAVSYRERQHIESNAASIAVVVQRMVSSDLAGVMFTANPVNGDRDEVVIDAAPGQGESVVSGAVTADHLILDRASARVKEFTPGTWSEVIEPKAGGGVERVALSRDVSPSSSVVPERTLRELVRLGDTIEQLFGSPQDIEWATSADRVFILQARPLTGLPAPMVATEAPQRSAHTTRRRRLNPEKLVAGLRDELFPFRPYPLDASSYTARMLDAIEQNMFAPLGFPTTDPTRLFTEQGGVITNVTFAAPKPSQRLLWRPWLTLWENRHFHLTRWRSDPVLQRETEKALKLRDRELASLSWDELLDTLREALDIGPDVSVLRRRYLPQAIVAVGLLGLLLALVHRLRCLSDLTSGIDTDTLAMNRELDKLAREIRANPDLSKCFQTVPTGMLLDELRTHTFAAPFLASLDALYRRYGHRETVLLMASGPAWFNDPTVAFGVLKALSAPSGTNEFASNNPNAGIEADTLAQWKQVRDVLLATTVLGRWPLRSTFLRLVSRARIFFALREDTHFALVLGLPVVHACYGEMGQRLAAAGALDQAADVLHLRLPEIESVMRGNALSPSGATALRETARWRKAERAKFERVPWRSAHSDSSTDAPEGALVSGLAGGGGTASGAVRVIMGPADFGELLPGEVLVAPFTSPSWTPLFIRAAAIIVDTGSPASHAAIVAREYGIPAVLATGNATTRLATGQRVRVDGVRGLVFAE